MPFRGTYITPLNHIELYAYRTTKFDCLPEGHSRWGYHLHRCSPIKQRFLRWFFSIVKGFTVVLETSLQMHTFLPQLFLQPILSTPLSTEARRKGMVHNEVTCQGHTKTLFLRVGTKTTLSVYNFNYTSFLFLRFP